MSAPTMPTKVALAGGVALLAVLASGCTAPVEPLPIAADTSVDESPADPAPIETVTALGPTGFPGIDFPIPSYARSLAIDFTCEGGGPFIVELGDSMMLGQSPLTGVCEGSTTLAWPVTERTGQTLSVTVADGVEWSAAFDFSEDEFATDEALAAECEQFSASLSALLNADNGLLIYAAIDEAEWSERVSQAAAELIALESSTSELGDAFDSLRALATDPAVAPGFMNGPAAAQPLRQASSVCDVNHTPVVIMGEFGG